VQVKFSGTFPHFECQCGAVKLGGPHGTLVIDGAMHLECQECKRIYRFDCRLQEIKQRREDLDTLTNEES
jgi:hypothetical protein